jgi:PAS domain S-box-containing protein
MFKKLKDQHYNLSIILGNLIMLILLGLVAITGISGVKQVANSNFIALESRREMADIRTMQLLIKNMANSQINYIYNGDPVDAQAFKNSIAALFELRSKIRKTIETENDRLNFNIINSQTDQYIANFTSKIIPARESNNFELLETLKDESDELISQIDPFIQNMLADYENKAQDAYLNALEAKNQTIALGITLSLLLGLLGGVTAIAISQNLAKNTRQIISSTEQLQKSAAALKESEGFLNSVIENIPTMIFIKKAPGLHYIRFNRTGENLIGLEPGIVAGKTDFDIFPKEDADFYRKKDLEVLAAKKLVDIPEEPIISKEFGVRTYHTKKIPILDETGEAKYLLGISEDITERKQAEDKIRLLNSELEQRVLQRTAQLESSNKELEAFSYSISHDLRAPLRAINGYAQLIKEDHAANLSPIAVNYFDLIRKNAIIMGQLVDDLLNFSRLGRLALSKKLVDPVPIVNSIIDSMRPELENRKIKFLVDYLPECEADPAFLKQVYVNLISNAVKFSKDKKESVVEIGFNLPSKSSNLEHKTAVPVIYFVQDNGIGFDMKYYDKLFGVFQRLHTDENIEGTGVGLAIVSRIVTRHGGRIWAESSLDKGSTFFFTLESEA